MIETPMAVCKVCKIEIAYHLTVNGTRLMPRDWVLYEDRTPDRTKAMAEVCSDKCVRKLRELNKSANNTRTGW